MAKRKSECRSTKYGWETIARKTPKGWRVDNQGPYGWDSYFLSDSKASNMKEPLSERDVRLLASWAQQDGKRLPTPNRGKVVTICDAYGTPVKVRR